MSGKEGKLSSAELLSVENLKIMIETQSFSKLPLSDKETMKSILSAAANQCQVKLGLLRNILNILQSHIDKEKQEEMLISLKKLEKEKESAESAPKAVQSQEGTTLLTVTTEFQISRDDNKTVEAHTIMSRTRQPVAVDSAPSTSVSQVNTKKEKFEEMKGLNDSFFDFPIEETPLSNTSSPSRGGFVPDVEEEVIEKKPLKKKQPRTEPEDIFQPDPNEKNDGEKSNESETVQRPGSFRKPDRVISFMTMFDDENIAPIKENLDRIDNSGIEGSGLFPTPTSAEKNQSIDTSTPNAKKSAFFEEDERGLNSSGNLLSLDDLLKPVGLFDILNNPDSSSSGSTEKSQASPPPGEKTPSPHQNGDSEVKAEVSTPEEKKKIVQEGDEKTKSSPKQEITSLDDFLNISAPVKKNKKEEKVESILSFF